MSEKFFDLLLDDSFIRFLNGTASQEEQDAWVAWMQEKKEHEELVKRGRRLLSEGLQPISSPNSKPELEKLLERIESVQHLKQKQKPIHPIRKPGKNVIWATLAAAAGILLIVGFLGRDFIFQYENTEKSEVPTITYRTISTEYGERKTFRYSDGSKIILNAGSQLRLPQNVAGNHPIEVWLQGEALFNINRKPAPETRNFIVHTADSEISVLGTLFAVNTNDGQTRVVLETGRLFINARDSLYNKDLKYEMVPGELALYSSQFHEIQVKKVNPDVYLSWAGDSLILDQTPFSDLIERIEFTYSLKVVVEDSELLKEKLTGRFGNLELEFLLEGLAKTLDVTIEKSETTIYIESNEPDGS